MFLEFYGLQEQPFGVTPDARFLFDTPAYREAWASLWYGIETGRGFIALIAEPGMGKTTLIYRLLEQLRGRTRTAFLFQTQCTSHDLLRGIVTELGSEVQSSDPAAAHEALHQILLQDARTGKSPVLIVDEAQNLTDAVLETVRLLSDFETPRAKLLQIVLAGQTELARRLSRPQLAQLRQRISILCRLTALSGLDVQRYIEHRLRVAGHRGSPLFTPEAYSLIASLSRGIPRDINNLCFHALSLACALQRRQVDVSVLEEVSADLDLRVSDSDDGKHDSAGDSRAQVSERGSPPGAAPNTVAPAATMRQSPAGGANIAIGSPSCQYNGIAVPQPPATAIVASTAVANHGGGDAQLIDNRLLAEQPEPVSATVALPPASSTTLDLLRRAYKHNRERTVRNVVSRGLSRINTRTAGLAAAVLIAVGMAFAWHRNVAEIGRNPGQFFHLLQPVLAGFSGLTSAHQPDAASDETPAATAPVSLQPPVSTRIRGMQRRRSQTSRQREASAAALAESPSGVADLSAARETTTTPDGLMLDVQGAERRIQFQQLSSAPPPPAKAATDPPAISNISSAADNTALASLVAARRDLPPSALETVRTFEGVIQGKLVKTVLPAYPPAARQSHREGAVVLSANVAADGRVQGVRVLSGDTLLVDAAVAAVKRWRYEPSYLNGKAINSERQITVNFKLGPH